MFKMGILDQLLNLEILDELDIDFNKFQKEIRINLIKRLEQECDCLQSSLNELFFSVFSLEYQLPDTDHFSNTIYYFHS